MRTYRSVHDGCLQQHAQGHQEPSPKHMPGFSRRAVEAGRGPFSKISMHCSNEQTGNWIGIGSDGFCFDHYTIERLFGWCGNFLRFTAVAMGIWTNSTSTRRASGTQRNRDITDDILAASTKNARNLDLARIWDRLSHMTCKLVQRWTFSLQFQHSINVPQLPAHTLGGSYQFILACLHSFHVINIHYNQLLVCGVTLTSITISMFTVIHSFSSYWFVFVLTCSCLRTLIVLICAQLLG